MQTVLYIDGSPLYLTDIKRNCRDKIIKGQVENGNWLLKLSDTVAYAFENWRVRYGWGDELVLRNEWPYTTYEEIHVDVKLTGDYNRDYNKVVLAADVVRGEKNAVWLEAWVRTAQSGSCVAPTTATLYADECLKQFKLRFPRVN